MKVSKLQFLVLLFATLFLKVLIPFWAFWNQDKPIPRLPLLAMLLLLSRFSCVRLCATATSRLVDNDTHWPELNRVKFTEDWYFSSIPHWLFVRMLCTLLHQKWWYNMISSILQNLIASSLFLSLDQENLFHYFQSLPLSSSPFFFSL